MTAPNDIFNDRDQLIRIWENERKTRDFAVKLMWENMKYFGAVFGALFAVYSTLVGHIYSTTSTNPIFNFLVLIPIPGTILGLSWFAQNDLQDRRKRFYLVVTHLLKLEDLLGLYKKIDDKLTYLKKDQYLFAQYYTMLQEYKKNFEEGKDQEQFIKCQMKKKSAFRSMQNVYIVMMIVAGILIFFGVIVICNPFLINPQVIYSI